MRSFQIESLFGIPMQLNISFLVILPILAWLIAMQVDQLIAVFNRGFGASFAADVLTGGADDNQQARVLSPYTSGKEALSS